MKEYFVPICVFRAPIYCAHLANSVLFLGIRLPLVDRHSFTLFKRPGAGAILVLAIEKC